MTVLQGAPPHIVVLGGEIDIATSPAVRRSLMAAISAGHVHLVADMAAARFIDARGIGVLVAAANAARGAGGGLSLWGAVTLGAAASGRLASGGILPTARGPS
jgi:anti-anti-sigma factor